MDYEKKYNELVEAVRKLYEANPSDDGIKNWVNDNVPELKESEDERIRKELINTINLSYHYGIAKKENRDKYISWLKKQGEQKKLNLVEIWINLKK